LENRKRILAVDDEPNMRRLLEISLRQAGYQPVLAANGKDALDIIQSEQIDLVVSDLHMPSMNGLALLEAIRADYEHLPFIMVTAQGEVKTAVEAMKLGAKDYILRPFDLETLEIAITRALSTQRLAIENAYFKEDKKNEELLIGNSPAMMKLKQLIAQVAPTKASVLITGQTGTGKEVIAQSLHQLSNRDKGLFIAVNCAAIPAEMLESELFGHEKGAFTGAVKERIGKFELSDGGTLFLDEITEMPIQLQAKLLRALQEGTIEKLGSNKKISLDLRIVAATNRPPLEAVKDGKLREDLYYRLNVFTLHSPALSERDGDIALLAQHFAKRLNKTIASDAIIALSQYKWPGNVRELQNIMERAAIICQNSIISKSDFPSEISSNLNVLALTGLAEPTDNPSNPLSIPEATAAIEKQLISAALVETQGNKAKAAKLLEISERSLWNKLNQYQLH
jgi:two-component system, NtrC family, response regulator AtoC